MFKPILIYLMLSIFPAVSGSCSKWTCWTPCSISCGSGSQERRQTCHYPARTRYRYRAECGGSRLESRPCTVTACPIEGNWGNWMDWSTCPVTCGGGMQVRSRLCNNPAPANNGLNCSGPDSERKSCEPLPCPIEGNWGNWMDWSTCPVTCGGGMEVRSRLCNNPAPANNGPNCSGPDSERKSCEPLPCQINGNWAGWLSWSPCSVSCGQGARNRKRTCSNPAPAFNGQDCSGSDSEIELCVLTACPINGNWAGWLSWSPCSVSCGQGARNRKRTCNNPAPAFNGQDCSGSGSETQLCVLTECPINGNWTGWLSWSPCSVSCGPPGERIKKRTCSNPAPAFNGQDCSGSGSERQLCVLTECPINGNWTGWLSWSPCSVSCGQPGERIKKRTCSNPAPAFNGQDCSGSGSERQLCVHTECPINGKWANWFSWSACSPSCGGGVQFRYRTCSDPGASNGGKICPGVGMESEFCDLPGCPI